MVIDKMGDLKEKYRQLAAQCLTTFWKITPLDVERIVKNAGLVGKNSRMKEASMTWVVQVSYPNLIRLQYVTVLTACRCTKRMACRSRASYLR